MLIQNMELKKNIQGTVHNIMHEILLKPLTQPQKQLEPL